MDKKKEILGRIMKFVNDVTGNTVPGANDITPNGASKEYELSNGQKVKIDKLEVGGAVTMADASGVPVACPAGDYNLKDGTVITIDGTGLISAVSNVPVDPASVDPADMDMAAKFASMRLAFGAETSEDLLKKYDAIKAAFGTGTPEDRIGNIELVCRALMQSSFGWQLQEAEQKALRDQAIAVYQAGFSAQTEAIKLEFKNQLDAKDQELKAAKQTFAAGMKEVALMFEAFINEPTDKPVEPVKNALQLKADDKEAKRQRFLDRAKGLQTT